MYIALSIATGAVIGALSRHYMTSWIARVYGTSFPWGTFSVNILGSFLMGVLIEFLVLKLSLSQEVKAFIALGILGSFTTFSAFSLDAALLIQRGEVAVAMLYALSSVMIGIGALFAGIHFARLLS